MKIQLQDSINALAESLKYSPFILRDMIDRIPAELLKVRRIPDKWSIHEHACHIVDVQPMLMKRFKQFMVEPSPVIKPFIPDVKKQDLLDMNLADCLDKFSEYRMELIDMADAFDDAFWMQQAQHPEYKLYTPHIMLRHILMHDHLHMYRIEELWLTQDDYLRK